MMPIMAQSSTKVRWFVIKFCYVDEDLSSSLAEQPRNKIGEGFNPSPIIGFHMLTKGMGKFLYNSAGAWVYKKVDDP
jgi:hypothetical protein